MSSHGGQGKNDFTFAYQSQRFCGENHSDNETGIEDSGPDEAAAAELVGKQQIGPTPNWLRLLDMVEITINNAQIANTELSPFYLNLRYHHHFWFDVPNLHEVRLEGDKTIHVRDWIKKMRADWNLVYRALYHEQTRTETFGNRKLADYQFKVCQYILINQRKHHRNQLGPVGP